MEPISDDDLIPPTSPTTGTNLQSPNHSPSSINNDLSSDDEGNANTKENRPNPLQNSVASFTQFRGAVLGDRGLFSEADGDEKKNMIWGTTVNTDQVQRDFREFINLFPDPNNPDEREPLYIKILDQMIITEETSLNLNAEYLWSFNETLYKQMINYPSEIIPIMDTAINQIFHERYHLAKYGNIDNLNNPEFSTMDRIPIQIRPFNLRTVKPMRDLDPEDIDKLITIRGMITRVSPIIPDLKQAYYECVTCRNSELALPDKDGTFVEPKQCSNCKGKQTISLIHNKSFFSDKQWIKLQETPDAIPEGETPHTVSIYAYDMLVDVAKPGDRIEVTGIFRATAVRNSNTQRVLRSIYKTYIDVIHFKKSEKHRMKAEDAKSNANSEFFTQFNEGDSDLIDSFVKEKEEKLKKLSQTPDIYDRLTRSLAPSVWELDDVKKGILCQLFGGTNKQFSDSGIGRCRGEINVLLCGDPGTSKSQLLQYVHKIAPRGIYTSGKGSSAVGLTAYITRDPESREAVLESGALVLSDRGICCIDEFDKMGDATRSILHEAMEQQTVSIAKAGIICTLNARTSILASANPRESRYNPRLSVVDNIQLPPTLLSRFDLIYLVLDKPEENSDRRLANHLVSLYTKDPNLKNQDYLDMATFTDYITYAKNYIHPKISDECVEDIVRGYLDMRKLGTNKKTITATPRQLESIIRIAEAHARMRYSLTVERIDVAEAIRLLRSATQQAAIDPKTGTIDMDLITTGRSATSRSRLAELVKELRNLLTTQNSSWRFDQLLKQMMDQSSVEITTNELREALKQLEEVEFVALGGSDRNPTITVL